MASGKLKNILGQTNTTRFTTAGISQKVQEQSFTGMSDDKKEGGSAWKDAGWFALKTAAISGAVLGGAAVALPAIGFTAGGVAAGSLAASYQSAFLGGYIASGSTFAVLQSVGAAGLAASTQAAVVAASATVAGAHSALKKLKKTNKAEGDNRSRERSENNMDDDEEDEAMEKSDKREVQDKTNKNVIGKLGSKKNNGTGNDKAFPIQFVQSYRNDDANSSPTLNYLEPKNEYESEMDSLRKKWEDVELSENLTITQHLIKKKK